MRIFKDLRVATASVAMVVWSGCGGDRAAPTPMAAHENRAAPEWFTDEAQKSGLDFVHVNGASGRFYYPEILPPGVAFLDYDNDGDLDVYLVQSRPLGAGAAIDGTLRGHLYRNDLQVLPDGSRRLHFTDVTEASGIDARGFGLGVAAADVDNDGYVDLLLTNFGPNQLFHNNGNGTFTDVTKASGLYDDSGRFAVSAAFLDYDRDGWLDLYVANNVKYTIANETKCPNMAGVRDYCPPQIYGGQPDRLYRNVGHGRFVDVSAKTLVGGKFGPALGVATADYNGDGWIDIYVANDGEENLLWLNQRDGTFRESALAAGAAMTGEGKAEASMGVDAGDADNDGDEDLIMTELTSQGSNLFVNDGTGRFRDMSAASGVGPLSLAYTGWGTAWFDFDNDGWLDTLAVNGTIVMNEGRTNTPFPYDQRNVLFRNLGNLRFENVTAQAGAVFALSESGRGAAFADVDNDGDIDVLVGNDNGHVRLLINNIGNRNHWIGLRLVGGRDKLGPYGSSAVGAELASAPVRDMLGARVVVTKKDGAKLWRRVRSDGSYGSANDPRVLVGLGASSEPVDLHVQWPDGRTEEWKGLAIDRWTTLKEGDGK